MGALELIAGLLPSVISAGASLGSTGWNIASQEKANEANKQYAMEMTQKQWARDDTSLQRQVADAKAANLSPLAVTGSVASSSPLAYQANASQMDLSGLLGSLASATNVLDRSFERGLKREEDTEQTRQFEKRLKADSEQFQATLEQNKEQFDSNQLFAMKSFDKQMVYQYKALNSSNWSQDSQNIIELSNHSLELYNQVCQSLGVAPETEIVTDLADYKTKYNAFMDRYRFAIEQFNGQFASRSTSVSTSYSNNQSVSGGIDAAGAGFSVGGSEGSGESATSSESYDNTPNLKALIMRTLNGLKFPIYRPVVKNAPDVGNYTSDDW